MATQNNAIRKFIDLLFMIKSNHKLNRRHIGLRKNNIQRPKYFTHKGGWFTCKDGKLILPLPILHSTQITLNILIENLREFPQHFQVQFWTEYYSGKNDLQTNEDTYECMNTRLEFSSCDGSVKIMQIRMNTSPASPTKMSILVTIIKASRIAYIFSRIPHKKAPCFKYRNFM
jgi:hypothetical protein